MNLAGYIQQNPSIGYTVVDATFMIDESTDSEDTVLYCVLCIVAEFVAAEIFGGESPATAREKERSLLKTLKAVLESPFRRNSRRFHRFPRTIIRPDYSTGY